MLTVYIHFVGPTSTIHIDPTQLCSWDQRGIDMVASRRVNVWSMSVPRHTHIRTIKSVIILFSNSFVFIFINYYLMLYVPSSKKMVILHIAYSWNCLWPCFLAITSTGRVIYSFVWFYVQEHPKAQPEVVLVLKRLRRRTTA